MDASTLRDTIAQNRPGIQAIVKDQLHLRMARNLDIVDNYEQFSLTAPGLKDIFLSSYAGHQALINDPNATVDQILPLILQTEEDTVQLTQDGILTPQGQQLKDPYKTQQFNPNPYFDAVYRIDNMLEAYSAQVNRPRLTNNLPDEMTVFANGQEYDSEQLYGVYSENTMEQLQAQIISENDTNPADGVQGQDYQESDPQIINQQTEIQMPPPPIMNTPFTAPLRIKDNPIANYTQYIYTAFPETANFLSQLQTMPIESTTISKHYKYVNKIADRAASLINEYTTQGRYVDMYHATKSSYGSFKTLDEMINSTSDYILTPDAAERLRNNNVKFIKPGNHIASADNYNIAVMDSMYELLGNPTDRLYIATQMVQQGEQGVQKLTNIKNILNMAVNGSARRVLQAEGDQMDTARQVARDAGVLDSLSVSSRVPLSYAQEAARAIANVLPLQYELTLLLEGIDSEPTEMFQAHSGKKANPGYRIFPATVMGMFNHTYGRMTMEDLVEEKLVVGKRPDPEIIRAYMQKENYSTRAYIQSGARIDMSAFAYQYQPQITEPTITTTQLPISINHEEVKVNNSSGRVQFEGQNVITPEDIAMEARQQPIQTRGRSRAPSLTKNERSTSIKKPAKVAIVSTSKTRQTIAESRHEAAVQQMTVSIQNYEQQVAQDSNMMTAEAQIALQSIGATESPLMNSVQAIIAQPAYVAANAIRSAEEIKRNARELQHITKKTVESKQTLKHMIRQVPGLQMAIHSGTNVVITEDLIDALDLQGLSDHTEALSNQLSTTTKEQLQQYHHLKTQIKGFTAKATSMSLYPQIQTEYEDVRQLLAEAQGFLNIQNPPGQTPPIFNPQQSIDQQIASLHRGTEAIRHVIEKNEVGVQKMQQQLGGLKQVLKERDEGVKRGKAIYREFIDNPLIKNYQLAGQIPDPTLTDEATLNTQLDTLLTNVRNSADTFTRIQEDLKRKTSETVKHLENEDKERRTMFATLRTIQYNMEKLKIPVPSSVSQLIQVQSTMVPQQQLEGMINTASNDIVGITEHGNVSLQELKVKNSIMHDIETQLGNIARDLPIQQTAIDNQKNSILMTISRANEVLPQNYQIRTAQVADVTVPGLQNDLQSVLSLIGIRNREKDQLKGTMTELQNSLGSLKTILNDAKTTKTDLDNKISKVQQTINDTIDYPNKAIAANVRTAGDVQQEIGKVQAHRQSISTSYQDMSDQYFTLSSALAALKEDKRQLDNKKERVEKLEFDIGLVSSRMLAVESYIQQKEQTRQQAQDLMITLDTARTQGFESVRNKISQDQQRFIQQFSDDGQRTTFLLEAATNTTNGEQRAVLQRMASQDQNQFLARSYATMLQIDKIDPAFKQLKQIGNYLVDIHQKANADLFASTAELAVLTDEKLANIGQHLQEGAKKHQTNLTSRCQELIALTSATFMQMNQVISLEDQVMGASLISDSIKQTILDKFESHEAQSIGAEYFQVSSKLQSAVEMMKTSDATSLNSLQRTKTLLTNTLPEAIANITKGIGKLANTTDYAKMIGLIRSDTMALTKNIQYLMIDRSSLDDSWPNIDDGQQQ